MEYLAFLNCPVICHVHELESAIQILGSPNLKLIKKNVSQFIAVSNSVRDNLVENHSMPADGVKTIHGFIPTGGATAVTDSDTRTRVRQELKIPANSRIICACGSVGDRKGTDLFLEVAAKVIDQSSNVPVHFIWVGGGAEQGNGMKAKVQSALTRESVHFIGSRAEVGPYYEASDIFLLTSREDPFPLVMMEASLHGLPIICFDGSGGASEFVGQDAGIIVRGFDITQMAKRVVELLGSDETRREYGKIGRHKVLTAYSLEVGAPKILAVIRQFIGGS